MTKITKFFIYSFLFTFFILVLLVLVLASYGIETKKFNPIIIEQVKKYNEGLNLDIKKVKVHLHISASNITSPKLKIRSKNPILIEGNNRLELKEIETSIDILSYFKDNFVIEKFWFTTRDNKIRELIKFAALENPSLIFYNIFIKQGYVNVNGFLQFDKNGKINNYNLNGEIKNGELKFNKNYHLKDINFNFKNQKKRTLINNTEFKYKKVKFLSNEIFVTGSKEIKNIKGDIRNEKVTINLKEFQNLFKNYFSIIKNQKVALESKNKFSFNVQKNKIKKLKYSSQINLDNINISLKNNFLKTYFGNYNDLILLKNNLINLKYENKNLEVEGESNYSFNTLFDKIEYKIKKKNNNYNFITSINFDQNLLEIKPIEYSKEKKKKSNLEIKGTYNKNKSKFNEINYNEGKNFFIIRDLIVNNNLKILDFKRIELHYLNDNNKINEINIEKNLANYNLNGRSFDTYKLINKVLFSENENTFLDNFNFKKEIKLNISIDKIFLDNKNFSKNLFGDLIFKDNKIYAINLTSNFENNDKFKLLVKTLTNKQKITSFYSDYAEPFIKHFKFIKGFKEGKIDFYSVREDNVSNSTLNIFDFKVKEMPALTKLLSLASLQGIADIMTGEGIRFNEFEMNFSNKNKLMTINEIYALGPAISILMSGYIESSKLVSLRGTLVPATTLNKVIGSLPFIGKILVGKKTGEGVFGVSFKIKGPPKNLKTTVNPIKTLTPRFITRTLEKAKK